jgi:hypothetical protein
MVGFGTEGGLKAGVFGSAFVRPRSDCVEGKVGGLDWWGMGSMPPGISTFPLLTNTRA